MSQQDNSGQNGAGRKPDFIAYNVRDSQDGKGYWNKVGAAWQHKDGQGYDIQLESVPVDGRVTLRELRDERMQGYQDQRQHQAPTQDRNRPSQEPQPHYEPHQGRGRSR